jgi:hypothetical protein
VRDVGFVDAEFGGEFGHGDSELAYLGAEFVCAPVARIPYRSASVHGWLLWRGAFQKCPAHCCWATLYLALSGRVKGWIGGRVNRGDSGLK